MPGNQLGHLKHIYVVFTVENSLQIFVGMNEAYIVCILQPVLSDINPKAFRYLGSRASFVTDNLCEFIVRLDWSHTWFRDWPCKSPCSIKVRLERFHALLGPYCFLRDTAWLWFVPLQFLLGCEFAYVGHALKSVNDVDAENIVRYKI